MIQKECVRSAAALVAGWLCTVVPAAIYAQTVAMVTDLSGKAQFLDSGQAISILTELPAGTRVRLDTGRMVVLYLKSGAEYSFSSAAQIEFREPAPSVTSGPAPQRRANPLGANVAVKPGAITQAAFVMRSGVASSRIRLLNLTATKTLETKPVFRWERIEAAKSYRFELTDGAGRVLVERDVESNSFKLPASISLQSGNTYTWEVSTRPADGRRHIGAGDFILADASLRQEVDRLRPGSNAPFSDRVTFALWLHGMELKDEARKYWNALAMERPGDARLKALSAE